MTTPPEPYTYVDPSDDTLTISRTNNVVALEAQQGDQTAGIHVLFEDVPGVVAALRAAAGGSATDQTADGGAGDERRERYAAAILAALARDTSHGPNWDAAADAAMTVADVEQQDLRDRLRVAEEVVVLFRTELLDLRAELGQARTTTLAEAADEAASHASFHGGKSSVGGRALLYLTKVLRRMAVAAADTTPEGAPGCWCGHPKGRHWNGASRMAFPDGCHDCTGWNGAHTYGRELPWESEHPATGTAPATDGGQP